MLSRVIPGKTANLAMSSYFEKQFVEFQGLFFLAFALSKPRGPIPGLQGRRRWL